MQKPGQEWKPKSKPFHGFNGTRCAQVDQCEKPFWVDDTISGDNVAPGTMDRRNPMTNRQNPQTQNPEEVEYRTLPRGCSSYHFSFSGAEYGS